MLTMNATGAPLPAFPSDHSNAGASRRRGVVARARSGPRREGFASRTVEHLAVPSVPRSVTRAVPRALARVERHDAAQMGDTALTACSRPVMSHDVATSEVPRLTTTPVSGRPS